MDALSVCDTVAFDKTGTLTTGELVCRVIEPLHGHAPPPPGSPLEWKLQAGEEGAGGQYGTTVASCCSPSCQEEALAVAAAMEAAATHPIARAVLEAVEGRSLPAVAVHDWEAVAGQGLAATVTTYKDKEHLMAGKGGGGGVKARMGSVEFVASLAEGEERQAGIHAAALAACKDKELVLAALAVDGKVSLFHFEDELREGAKEVVEELQGAEGLRLLMLTGDREASARRVGEAVGIKEVFWGLKPEDKLGHVQRMAEEAGGRVGGDGANRGRQAGWLAEHVVTGCVSLYLFPWFLGFFGIFGFFGVFLGIFFLGSFFGFFFARACSDHNVSWLRQLAPVAGDW